MKGMQKKTRSEIAFQAKSKEGPLIRTTKAYWNIITHIKHPSVKGHEKHAIETLTSPDEIRVSKRDRSVCLFYKKYRNKHLCVVAKISKNRGFIITAYHTKKIKEGELKWKR